MTSAKRVIYQFDSAMRLLVLILAVILSSCVPHNQPPNTQVSALAPILETITLWPDREGATYKSIEFSVPESGNAILAVENRPAASDLNYERMWSAEIRLNDRVVYSGKLFHRKQDVLTVQVSLLQGANRLEISCSGKPSSRLSVRIDAPADRIVMSAVPDLPLRGGAPVEVKATVTGLGVPVPKAEVLFRAQGAGTRIERVSLADQQGTATAIIAGFNAGDGLVGPHGVDAVPSGSYRINTSATILATGEATSREFTVKATEPGTPHPLLLGTPRAQPAGLPVGGGAKQSSLPGAKGTTRPDNSGETTIVKFLVLVAGTSTPPQFLYLDEVDAQGKPLSAEHLAVATLKDDGKGVDTRPGDFAYTGTYKVPDQKEAERYFRARAVYFGKTVLSGSMTFGITPFPLRARRSDQNKLVDDPHSDSRYYSNEVVLKVVPGVLSSQIREFAAAAGGEVVGVVPPLRTYLLDIAGNGEASGVQKAIAVLSLLDGVERASPNHVVKAAAFPSGQPNDDKYCSGPSDETCQWHLQKVQALEAWQLAGGGAPTQAVAILDIGVDCSHADLIGKCARDDAGRSDHGTGVAGIIAAIADNDPDSVENATDIVGVAYGTELYPYLVADVYAMLEGTFFAGLSGEEKIINISQVAGSDDGSILDLVCGIIDSNRLVVAAAGNPSVPIDCNSAGSVDYFPATYNTTGTCSSGADLKGGLLVVGATDINDKLARWEEGGSSKCSDRANVDLYAPGKNIYTTSLISTTHPAGIQQVSGTSFATPIVSAAAAILWSRNPTWTPREVHDRLISRADMLTSGAGDLFPIGGNPRLNLKMALGDPPTDIILPPANLRIVENCINGTVLATLSAVDPDGDETFAYSFVDSSGASTQDIRPFRINRDTGVITLTGCPLDSLTNLTYDIAVRVADSVNFTYDENFTIRVQGVYAFDFETPDLAAEELMTMDPYETNNRVSFRVEDDFGFPDAVVGLVKNRATSACGLPGQQRARSEITASAATELAYAVLDMPDNTPAGGRVFVIDNVPIEE